MGMDRSSARVTRRHALLLGAAIVSAPGRVCAQGAPVGTVDALRGNAFAEGSSPRRALQPTADVFVNDLIETEIDSSLTIHLGKATLVKLGALVKLRVDKFVVDAGGTFELDQGPLLIDRDDRAKSESLQVRSPFALIAARGTMFFAGPSNDVFGVFVARGVVSVTGGGRTVILRPGLGTNIAHPGDAPSQPKRWSPERIAAALRSVG
jgi:hypothetical protein